MQQQVQKRATTRSADTTEEVTTPPAADTAETDAILDEIDGILEQNAEEFVKNYRQKGGE